MNPIRYGLVLLVLVFIQGTVSGVLAIGQVSPDLVLIAVVYAGVRLGQVPATGVGFVAGLLTDFFSTLWGLGAFSKTLAGFISGYFHRSRRGARPLNAWELAGVTFLAALVHNLFYFALFSAGTELGLWTLLLRFGLGGAFYTAVVALGFGFLLFRRGAGADPYSEADE